MTTQQLSFDMTPATGKAAKPASPVMAQGEPSVPLFGRARSVFDAMRAVVEAPGSILKHYKQDFYKYDAAYLGRTHGIGKHLWILRDSGTHLVRIGVHPRMHMELEAALDIGCAAEIYLIDPDRVSVRSITKGRAHDLIKQYEYTTQNGCVLKGGETIASLNVSFTPYSDGRSPQGIVKISSTGATLRKADLIALRQIAECEVIAASHSLFTGTQSCTLDGQDVFDLIEQA